MDPQDKLRFEIHGKSSVKYHLKANHQVEAKRWFWALNNAIQWSKDEAREEEKRQTRETEALRQAKMDQATKESDAVSTSSSKPNGRNSVLSPVSSGALGVPLGASRTGASTQEDDEFGNSTYDASVGGPDPSMFESRTGKSVGGDMDDDDDYGDDVSSDKAQPVSKDAFNITAQSVKLQLDLLAQVSAALQAEKAKNPSMAISDPSATQALSSYEGAVSSLKGLVGDLFRIARDRDAYWQYRLDREANVRRMWEESMAKVAREQEELETRIGESEDKRKRTKKALRDALQGLQTGETSQAKGPFADTEAIAEEDEPAEPISRRRKSSVGNRPNLAELSDSESDDEEFFDAIQEGDVEVVESLPVTTPAPQETEEKTIMDLREAKAADVAPSFQGYEDPVRERLKMDDDNRPKISLWVSCSSG